MGCFFKKMMHFLQKTQKMMQKNPSLHLLTQFDKNYNIWVSCKCIVRGSMKIQPISINNFLNTSIEKKKEVKSSTVNLKSKCSIPLSNTFYYPVNFTAQKNCP